MKTARRPERRPSTDESVGGGIYRRMLLAYSSRSFEGTARRSLRDAWNDTGRLAFLLRTIERSERVHRGMRARGGRRPPSPYERTDDPSGADYLFVGAALASLLAAGVFRWVG